MHNRVYAPWWGRWILHASVRRLFMHPESVTSGGQWNRIRGVRFEAIRSVAKGKTRPSAGVACINWPKRPDLNYAVKTNTCGKVSMTVACYLCNT